MKKFIYVFNKQDRDSLLSLGFSPLKQDDDKDVYIFLNTEKLAFNLLDIKAVLSDIMTF